MSEIADAENIEKVQATTQVETAVEEKVEAKTEVEEKVEAKTEVETDAKQTPKIQVEENGVLRISTAVIIIL